MLKTYIPHISDQLYNKTWKLQHDGAEPHRANRVEEWLSDHVPALLKFPSKLT